MKIDFFTILTLPGGFTIMMRLKVRWLFLIVAILSMSFVPISFADEITLSCTEWEPFNSTKLLNDGFFTEYTRVALERSGHKVKIAFRPWLRALKLTQSGKFTGLMGASHTIEREEFFIYPKYSWKNSITFFSNSTASINYKSLKDLCPSTVGVLNGSFLIEKLKPTPCITIQTTRNVETSIRMLFAGRIDLLLEAKDSIYYAINNTARFKDKKDQIIPVFPPFQIDKVYTVFSKKIPNVQKIVEDYDKGINMIIEDGTFDKILEKHGIQ